MQRVGFIGIGLMGKEMSRRILEAGYPLTVWNRTKARAEFLLKAGSLGRFPIADGSRTW
jgi:3-hydroxyisobutyrate dehydrogenase